ncbi:MAG: carboxypeptidase-like regulatory domain-containing protein, partial [Pedobacter sp.]|nr:carboxypeptidase-like regulatory domain-containing protein [Pedobacter sp.]
MKILKFLIICVMIWGVPTHLYAQRKISGQVFNEKSEPLKGVTVLVEGMPTEITQTDEKGRFQITATKGTLLITNIGYKNQRVDISQKTTFNIFLESENKDLEEVVVVGYGTQSKRNITGAVSNIKSEDIVRTSSTTAAGALAGKVQGVSVRAKDARPGRGASIE